MFRDMNTDDESDESGSDNNDNGLDDDNSDVDTDDDDEDERETGEIVVSGRGKARRGFKSVKQQMPQAPRGGGRGRGRGRGAARGGGGASRGMRHFAAQMKSGDNILSSSSFGDMMFLSRGHSNSNSMASDSLSGVDSGSAGAVVGGRGSKSRSGGGKKKRKRILNRLQRQEATLREKRRMLKLNKAFEELRKVLPISEFAKNKLSRAETLKSAIEYIEKMSELLQIF
jgi:hypothetical protein